MASRTPIPNNQIRSRNTIEQHEHCDDASARRVKIVDEYGNAINDGNPLAVNATVSGAADARSPFIFRIAMPSADTEYEFQFPLNTDQFILRPLKNKGLVKFSYIIGETNTAYDIIKPGNTLPKTDLKLSGTTKIFFQSPIPNNTMLIQVWTI